MNVKVKEISSNGVYERSLDTLVNEWIKAHVTIEVVDIKYSVDNGMRWALIIYTTRGDY